jgi:hypothetical protein
MTGLTDYTANNLLNWLTGGVAQPALPSVWIALYTAVGIDAGTGFTEVTGGSYTRVQVAGTAVTNGTTAAGNAILHFASVPAWIVAGMEITDTTAGTGVIPIGTTVLSVGGTTVTMSANAAGGGVGNGDTINFNAFSRASGSAPGTITNNAVITFPQATANWGTVIGFGLCDGSAGGNILAWDYMGNFSWLPCTVSSASPGVITAKAHGYSASDSFIFSTEYGGTAPSFSQSNFTGILTVTAPVVTDSFTAVNVATAVNTSSTGSGSVRKITQQSIPINVTASFAQSNLTLTAA